MADEEVRTVSSTGGEKGAKPARYDLIPPEALETLAKLYGRGAEKYADHNWRRGFEWSKSYAALQRHANQFWDGEDLDPETGLPHMAAVAWHAFTLLTFMQEQRGFDDRFVSLSPEQVEIMAANRREFIASMEAQGATFTPLGHRENCARQLHGHTGPCSL